MKIITVSNNRDYRNSFELILSTSESHNHLNFRDGEPEDNNISRKFNDVYSISDLLKLAYEAGRNGESLDIEDIEIETEYQEALWEENLTEQDVKNFLSDVDNRETELIEKDGWINNYYFLDNPLIKKIISNDIVETENHAVLYKKIIQILDRFFEISYWGIGKDLDEYVDYSWTEVKPKIIETVVYEPI